MEFASAGTASAEGLRMDSKEAPEDEEGLKAQGHFLPLSSETPSSLVHRVRTSATLLYCALTSKGRRRTPIARAHISALPRISPEDGRRSRRTDEMMIILPLETSVNRVRSKPCRKSLRPAVKYCGTACDHSPSSKLQGCGVNHQPARREGEQSQKRFDTRLMQEGK